METGSTCVRVAWSKAVNMQEFAINIHSLHRVF